MRQKHLELRKAQTMERIEAKLDILLKYTGYDPETLEELSGLAREPESKADKSPVEPEAKADKSPVEPEAKADEPATPVVEPNPVHVDEPPKSKSKSK